MFSTDVSARASVFVDATADSIRFSLLTCGAGEEPYSLFGHTAVRYECPKKHIDSVFNYGIFDFDAPNFIWRFVKGETDYSLGVVDYRHFAAEYIYYNRTVWEQTLNLTAEEKRALAALLTENARSENRIYRYNFLYDNCATRPRDKIEECLNGEIHYINNHKGRTFRDIIYEYTSTSQWVRFGIDICLGSEADKQIDDDRLKMFAPLYLMSYVASATITDNDGQRPLVSGTSMLIEEDKTDVSAGFPLTPLQAALLLLLIVVFATIVELRKQKCLWGLDMILFVVYGICGCLITFLMFFSEHPAVSPNYLIFVFHPLHILCVPFMIRREIKGQRNLYHLLNVIVLTLFIVLWAIIPQRFNLAVLPLSLCLLLRSASNLILNYKHTQ
ncbi:hypothetical protein EZS27_015357 [termite gut metagenome]|uniref:Uncharacterized protein n=1 Tax=termite gut metagenome TaxID=433724 RepID=A0A5J4RU36_9ZZZZ